MKLIFIMGKSSSGKDTIYNLINEELKLNSYVMYTTRPMREGEIEGKTYNFVSTEQMQNYINEKRAIEYRTYSTAHGPWTYATIKDSQFDNADKMLMPGQTLESYIEIKEYFKDDKNIELLPIYIEVPDNIRLKRAIEREEKQKEPKYVEMCRRFIADSNDFSEENIEKAGISRRFQNINLNECVKEIIEYIKIK